MATFEAFVFVHWECAAYKIGETWDCSCIEDVSCFRCILSLGLGAVVGLQLCGCGFCGCTIVGALVWMRSLGSSVGQQPRTLLSCSPIQCVLPKFYNSKSHTHCSLHSVSKQCDTACYNRPSVVSGGFLTVQHWQLRYSAKAYWFVQGGFCVCKYRVSFGLAHKSDTVE